VSVLQQTGNELVRPEGQASRLDSVLIAEDDPIFRRVLQSWLQKWNYRVTAVENGLDAWNALQADNDAPQMVILDWMMPSLDGVEVCRRIRSRKQGPYRYVLLLTAKDARQDVVAGLDAGADDYLTKPFDIHELRARMQAGRRILELQEALIQAQESLQFEAAHDRLTGLWNRGAILDWLQKELQRRQRSGDALGVIMADVDHFKKINDTYGHLVGDAVLQEVGKRLAAGVRSYDYVGRYGGEEFLVVVPGCDAAGLVLSAERLRHGMAAEPIDTSAGPIPVTLSLGLASVSPGKNHSVEQQHLLHAADAALYRAKTKGRNRAESAPDLRAAAPGSA
jgi:two-component system cell cycle response regulator